MRPASRASANVRKLRTGPLVQWNSLPQTQSSVDISKSSFRLTYSLKVARGIFGADVLTSSNFQDFVCNV